MRSKRPQDGRDKVFAFSHPVDLLQKLRWEHDQFFRALYPPESLNEARFHALNACVTAYQLCDWVAFFLKRENGWQKASQQLGVTLTSKKDIHRWFYSQGPLVACQQIALAYKHVEIDFLSFRAEVQTRETTLEEPTRGRRYEFTVRTASGEWDLVHVLSTARLVWQDALDKLGWVRFVNPIDHHTPSPMQ